MLRKYLIYKTALRLCILNAHSRLRYFVILLKMTASVKRSTVFGSALRQQ